MAREQPDTSAEIRHELKERLKHSSELRFLHRLQCVLLVSNGQSRTDVARWYGDDPSSIARWVRYYREFGIEGLQEDRRTGRPITLDIDQRRALERDLRLAPDAHDYAEQRWNGELLAAHIKKLFGVELSIRQCQRLLRQLQAQNAPHGHSGAALLEAGPGPAGRGRI